MYERSVLTVPGSIRVNLSPIPGGSPKSLADSRTQTTTASAVISVPFLASKRSETLLPRFNGEKVRMNIPSSDTFTICA